MLIWIHAPRGFRPSNWVDMLCDIDEAFDLDRHLIDPAYVTVGSQKHLVLQLACTSLLDEAAPQRTTREALFQEMMARAAALGLQVTVPDGFARTYPAWWDWLRSFCGQKRVVLRTHQTATGAPADP